MRMIRPLLSAALLACAALPAGVHGQEEVRPGTRVRILAPAAADTLIKGTVVAVDSAALLLYPGGDRAGLRVPLGEIRRVEVAGDPHVWRRRGRLWGSVAGAGAAYYLAGGAEVDCTGCGGAQVLAMLAGAGVGALVGTILGFNADAGREPWRQVPVPAPAP